MFLLDHLPAGLHLVIASRADPPLALARLRARGQLAELRAADLRFTSEEAATLLSEAAGPAVSVSALMVLEARTEGWAAGLRLAVLSLRGHVDVAQFVATFSGSHRYVLDYLTEEVLDRQAERVRTFLLETSVLDRLNGPLCDAVTGRADGQAMLEAVEAAGLFLMPLDDVRGWWRYHQLFADLLRARLQQERPDRIAVLHRNAAFWYQQHGLPDDAVRHALAAGDAVWAARLIEQQFDALYYLQGERTTAQRWLSALPSDVVRSRPRLLVAQAAIADSSGQVEVVELSLAAAERVSTVADDEPFEPSAGPAASLLERARDDRNFSRLPRRAAWRRRGYGRARVAGPSRGRGRRIDAPVHHPGTSGRRPSGYTADWRRPRMCCQRACTNGGPPVTAI